MNGTCKTCKWWDDGECVFVGDEQQNPLTRFEIVVTVADDHNLRVSLHTGPDFGCNQHSQRGT